MRTPPVSSVRALITELGSISVAALPELLAVYAWARLAETETTRARPASLTDLTAKLLISRRMIWKPFSPLFEQAS
jgi:hypothetical protein